MASPLFLTAEELQHLTGYKYPACQARALTEMGIRFHRNRLGQVVVARSAVDSRQGDTEDAPFVLRQIK